MMIIKFLFFCCLCKEQKSLNMMKASFISLEPTKQLCIKRMALDLDSDSTSAQQLRQTSLCLSFFISEMEIILPTPGNAVRIQCDDLRKISQMPTLTWEILKEC